jgi:adenylate cyclase
MDCLTEAVVAHEGFVVDYFGDGLMAMWNAPAAQSSHAELACRAALSMLDTLPTVAAEWVRVIHTDLRLGIGIHTGNVQIGNAGSKQRAKYGARGPNVHVASRVEAATKEIRLPLIATQSTVEQISNVIAAHRVCRASLPGLKEPLDLYCLTSPANAAVHEHRWKTYGHALQQFERGNYEDAAVTLSAVDPTIAAVPSQFLLDRIRREIGHQMSRRRTDTPASLPGGVIAITAK